MEFENFKAQKISVKDRGTIELNQGSSIVVTKGENEAKVVVNDGENLHELTFPAQTGTLLTEEALEDVEFGNFKAEKIAIKNGGTIELNQGSSIKVTKGGNEAKVVVDDGENLHELTFPAQTGTLLTEEALEDVEFGNFKAEKIAIKDRGTIELNQGSSIVVTKGINEGKVVVIDGETTNELTFPAKTGTLLVEDDIRQLQQEVTQQGELIAFLMEHLNQTSQVQIEVQDPTLEVNSLESPFLNITNI